MTIKYELAALYIMIFQKVDQKNISQMAKLRIIISPATFVQSFTLNGRLRMELNPLFSCIELVIRKFLI